MTMMHQYLPYRGQLKGLVTAGSQAAFITVHEEDQATALYRLDASDERVTMTADDLPCGATAIVSNGKTLWFAGQDGAIYQSPLAKGKPKAWSKPDFSQDKVTALALLSADRMAVLQSRQLSIVDRKKQTVLQRFSITTPAWTMGSNPAGDWLALGDSKGQVSVYCSDESADFVLSSEAQVHQGSVTAICFEANELRFYSAGADKKLFSTHAQGALQPLDKGRSSNHDKTIGAILLGKERFFTAASDKTIKSWAYAGGQPVTFKECNAKLTAVAPIMYRDKPCLLAVGTDASIGIVGLTDDEKFTELKWQLNDGYQLGSLWLSRDKPTEREQGLALLAGYDDKKALEIIARHFGGEGDRALRDQIVTLISAAKHAHSTVILEGLLANKKHGSVRKLAFEALVKRADAGSLHPYEKALATTFADVAEPALELLAKLTKKEPRAVTPMVAALHQHPHQRVRLLALSLLEKVYDKTSPKASLQALQTNHADLQRAALIRLFQRNLLGDINVKRAILLAQDHADEQLRHTAFLVSVLSRKPLAQALKTREPDLARQLQELEDFELLAQTAPGDTQTKAGPEGAVSGLVSTLKKVADRVSGKADDKGADKAPRPSSLAKLVHDDFTILLQGMTNRHADICFMSAFSLSVLEDQRAFGLLLLLSQEDTPAIRAGVCRAFGWLKQTDGIPTLELMLNDGEAGVRDAAFTALQQLQSNSALTAERGFASDHEDIHARALKALLDMFSGKLTKAGQTQALGLLTEALNDPFEAIRKETFKACLNRQLGGSEEETLRLLLASRFENIHLEVLNELMAKAGGVSVPEWVEPLLLALFNDDFEAVRKTAFNFAIAEKKRFERRTVLGVAVASEFLDVRQWVFRQIQKRPTQAEQAHLQQLLDDKDDALRNAVLSVIVDSRNNIDLLHKALESTHDDVRVNAAKALAKSGDERVYAVLEMLTSREPPKKKHEFPHWLTITEAALEALGILGDPRGFAIARRFIADENPTLVQQAAYTLPWVSNESHLTELNKLITDERDQVRMMAALSLALLGEKAGHLVLAQQDPATVNTYVEVRDQLAAALCQPEVTITTLQPFLTNSQRRFTDLLVLASHELLLPAEEPVLITRALSIAEPSVQLFSADLMVRFSEPEQCWEYIRRWLAQPHRSKDDDTWDISTDTLRQMAAVLVHGEGHLKARLLQVMNHLEHLSAKKTWELHYQAFGERYAEQIAQAEAQVSGPKTVKPAQNKWNQRAFGAYLGLVRQQSPRSYKVNPYALQGLSSMSALAARDESMRGSVNSCLLTLLNHQHVDIRQMAFGHLKESGFDAAQLGNTAITSPQSDIATQGLELLTQHYPLKQSRHLLEGLITSDNEILSYAAYQLYRDENGLPDTAEFALQSDTLHLRGQCVYELGSQYDNHHAQQWLLTAATNNYANVAVQAGLILAQHQHPKALAILKQQLEHEADQSLQNSIVLSLRQLPDVAVAEYLLDYVLNNKLNRQPAERMYHYIAGYRHSGLFATLLDCLETRPKERRPVMKTLLAITGYDQHLADYEQEQPDQKWLEKQHPRHDALLIQYFNTLIRLDHHADAAALQQAMSWVKDQSADAALSEAIPVIAEKYLSTIIEAIVYRVERRDGDTAGLLRVLDHKDSAAQFIAAEGLANNGHAQGFNVLFAAVDYQESADYRERAVLALGKLGDQRALDKLLKLAEDREHALNAVAVEAIGHMRESEHAEKIFKLLKSSLEKAGTYSDMNKHALNGLRWFGSLAAWQLIGRYATSHHHYWEVRQHAAELLRYRDTEGNRELLLTVIRTDDDPDVVMTAYESARLLWGVGDDQCSEVDYALIQGACPEADDKALARIVKHAPTADLLMLLDADYALDDEDELAGLLRQLGDSLLRRDDYSADELTKALQSENAVVVSIIARLLIRMESLTQAVQQALQVATARFYQRWLAQRLQFKTVLDRRGELARTHDVLLQLLWSCVQQGVVSPVVTQLLNTQDKYERASQLHILNGLLARDALYDQAMVQQLTHLLQSPVHKVSELAGQLLAREGDQATLNWQNFLSQPEQLSAAQFTGALQTAAAESAHQAQALPALISRGDTATLHAIAADERQQESLRIGALEGLACILSDAAGQALGEVHKNSADKDVAKAAYRALRRQQRAQQRSQPATQSAATMGEG